MRRVVVTGMGIVSCIGTDKQTVLASLQQGKSGIVYRPEYEQRGMRSHVAGAVDLDFSQFIDRKDLRRQLGRLRAQLFDMRRHEMDHPFQPHRQLPQRLRRAAYQGREEVAGWLGHGRFPVLFASAACGEPRVGAIQLFSLALYLEAGA